MVPIIFFAISQAFAFHTCLVHTLCHLLVDVYSWISVWLGRFYTRWCLIRWDELGPILVIWLWVSSIKTGTRCIILLDKLSFKACRSRRINKDSSSRRIMHLVPVFILETHNQTNYKYWPKLIQMDNASSSIKTAIVYK